MRVKYIVDSLNWALANDGFNLQLELRKLGISLTVSDRVGLFFGYDFVHFASQYMFVRYARRFRIVKPRARLIVTFFHGDREDGPEVQKHIEQFLPCASLVEIILVSNSLVFDRLIFEGVEPQKIRLIPLGVDTKKFSFDPDLRNQIRRKLNLSGKVVIGSCQKDSIGWQSGKIPKYVKGPDVFLQSIFRLPPHVKEKLVVLLAGPARHYLIANLSAGSIEVVNLGFVDDQLLPHYYQAMDIYLMTSREEGGPKGILEALASGVPVMSTRVGMAPDLVAQGCDGIELCREEEISQRIEHFFDKGDVFMGSKKKIAKGVAKMSWEKIASKYANQLYTKKVSE